MSIRSLVKGAEKYAIDNSPTLLTAFGVTGTLTTAFLTGKATFKAAAIINDAEVALDMQEIRGPELDRKAKTKLVWKCYIPPAVAVGTTIGCIVAANTISTSRMAAMAAAFTIAERNFGEYKEKVTEALGKNKEQEVRDKINQDRVSGKPPTNSQLMVGDGSVVCFDKYSGRYFESDMESLRQAENDIVKGLFRGQDDVVTLSDYYDKIGMDRTKFSDEVGWTADRALELRFSSVLTDKGKPVMVIDFNEDPFPVRSYFGHP
jgi:hypothetical protein